MASIVTFEYRVNEVLKTQNGSTTKEISETLNECPKKLYTYLINNKNYMFENDLWYKKKDAVVITFETERSWLDEQKTEAILKAYPNVWNDDVTNITLRFVDCSILLESISRIVAFINQLTFHNKKVTADFTSCKIPFYYLCRAGVFDLVHKSVNVKPKVKDCASEFGSTKTLIEFGKIAPYSTKTELPKKLQAAFSNFTNEELARRAFTFISEFINNIIEHSHTPSAGFAALQCYQGKRQKIQTVFSDNGKGIINTLRAVLKDRYPELEQKYPQDIPHHNAELLKEVFTKGGISGADDDEYKGRGLGFKASADKASQFNAKITIRQEIFALHLTYSDGKLSHSDVTFNLLKLNGTHIVFDIYLD
ncbi:hypothetical protein UA38_22305 [Photobacterium kishitanii]|nr:hypothetical protein UA38_22305 [Photobacterium kishitanii]KJG62825.1 hypothetical protein UA40_22660 [Photobacterium kishitanii]